MVKLSDALRGAADRAPLDGVTVSADAASRRVSMHRGLRGTATGLVGATAVTVLALGVIGPQGLGRAQNTEDSGAVNAEAAAGAPDLPLGTQDFADGSFLTGLAWGVCGQELGEGAVWGDPTVAISVATKDAEPGSPLPVSVTTTALAASDLFTTAPGALVLWDGIVVGSLPQESLFSQGPADEQIVNQDVKLVALSLAKGETNEFSVELPLENCWDGARLPSGKYELLITQEFYESASVIEPGPATTPSGEPTTDEPTQFPTPETTASAEPGDVIEPSAPISPEGADVDLPAPQPAVASLFRAAAEPVGFAITGDAVDNPFAQYLGEDEPPVVTPTLPPVEPPAPVPAPLPDGTLTADQARQMFNAGLTDSQWDMAKGSQRWLLTNDSSVEYNDNDWQANYYGCSADGTAQTRFPKTASQIDLVTLTGDLPARISLSYGWIVNGNPKFSLTATNVSDASLTGLAPALNSSLYLVRDGLVVAEAYGVNPDPRSGVVMYDEAADAVPTFDEAKDLATMVAPSPYNVPVVGPGESVSSSYLWRDVTGCWDGSGQTVVTPGVYTVLGSEYISVGTQPMYYAEPIEDFGPGAVRTPNGDVFGPDDVTLDNEWPEGFGDATDSGVGTSQSAPMPADVLPELGVYDSVDLQVWTSYGTLTVG